MNEAYIKHKLSEFLEQEFLKPILNSIEQDVQQNIPVTNACEQSYSKDELYLVCDEIFNIIINQGI